MSHQVGLLIGSVTTELTRKGFLPRMDSVVTAKQALVPTHHPADRAQQFATVGPQVDEVELIERSDVSSINFSRTESSVVEGVVPCNGG